MDRETRFLLANLITKTREVKDARRLFQEAKKKEGQTRRNNNRWITSLHQSVQEGVLHVKKS